MVRFQDADKIKTGKQETHWLLYNIEYFQSNVFTNQIKSDDESENFVM